MVFNAIQQIDILIEILPIFLVFLSGRLLLFVQNGPDDDKTKIKRNKIKFDGIKLYFYPRYVILWQTRRQFIDRNRMQIRLR